MRLSIISKFNLIGLREYPHRVIWSDDHLYKGGTTQSKTAKSHNKAWRSDDYLNKRKATQGNIVRSHKEAGRVIIARLGRIAACNYN